MTDNEIKAKAFIVGRKLERIAWWDMTSTEAWQWCKSEAAKLGAEDNGGELCQA